MVTRLWHANPDTGKISRCSASEGRCPFGSAMHGDSREDTQKIYEKLMENTTKWALKKSFPIVSLDDPTLFPEYNKRKDIDPRTMSLEDVFEQSKNRKVICPDCGKPLGGENSGLAAISMQSASNAVWCNHCEAYYDSMDEPGLEPNIDSPTYGAVVAENVSKITWYHTTNKENWADEILYKNGPEFVHIGGEAAAADRAASSMYGEGFDHYIYVIEVDKEVSVDPIIFEDDGVDFVPEEGHEAVRYLNRYEDTGSISLAIQPERIKIVGRALINKAQVERMGTYLWEVPEEMFLEEERLNQLAAQEQWLALNRERIAELDAQSV